MKNIRECNRAFIYDSKIILEYQNNNKKERFENDFMLYETLSKKSDSTLKLRLFIS